MGNMFQLGDCRRGIIRLTCWVGGWVERGVLCLEGWGWIGLDWVGRAGWEDEGGGLCRGVVLDFTEVCCDVLFCLSCA